MYSVKLIMKDAWTNEEVIRDIDITNVMNMRSDGFFMGTKEEQRQNIENWIEDKGNDQHDTWLDLVSWELPATSN
jgi:hypothetical protein